MSNHLIELITITPFMAKQWLMKNNGNRKLRNDVVNAYARAMVEGNWTDSNDAICFDKDGNLLNGQHRLNACIRAGVSFKSIVRYDCPAEAFAHMDTGATRSHGDIVRSIRADDPIARCNGVRATIKCLYGLANNLNVSHMRFSATEELEMLDKWRGVAELVYRWHSTTAIGTRTYHRNTFTLCAAVCAVANGIPVWDVDNFISVMCNRAESSIMPKYNLNAALALKDKLKAGRAYSFNLNEDHYGFTEAKKAIYMFTQNVKRSTIKMYFPINNAMIDRLDKTLRKGWNASES